MNTRRGYSMAVKILLAYLTVALARSLIPCAELIACARATCPAITLSLIVLLDTVLNPAWSWLGAGEIPSPAAFIGGATIVGAVLASIVAGRRRSLAQGLPTTTGTIHLMRGIFPGFGDSFVRQASLPQIRLKVSTFQRKLCMVRLLGAVLTRGLRGVRHAAGWVSAQVPSLQVPSSKFQVVRRMMAWAFRAVCPILLMLATVVAAGAQNSRWRTGSGHAGAQPTR